MAKHLYTLLFLILCATECCSYNIVPEQKQSNVLKGQFIKVMQRNMKGNNQPLGPRKLPDISLGGPVHIVDGCETWPCNPLNDQCYDEVACGPCDQDESDPSLFFCTDLPDHLPPPDCLMEPCGEDPNHCLDIGCGECDPATDKCTLLPHGCEQERCDEVDTCVEDGCGECDVTVCTAP